MSSIIATDLKPIVLDTHIFIWLVSGGDFLSDKIKNIIRESTKEGCVFISAITLWEIALLNSKNRIKLGLNIKKLRKIKRFIRKRRKRLIIQNVYLNLLTSIKSNNKNKSINDKF